jgi:hypothetical protein
MMGCPSTRLREAAAFVITSLTRKPSSVWPPCWPWHCVRITSSQHASSCSSGTPLC